MDALPTPIKPGAMGFRLIGTWYYLRNALAISEI